MDDDILTRLRNKTISTGFKEGVDQDTGHHFLEIVSTPDPDCADAAREITALRARLDAVEKERDASYEWARKLIAEGSKLDARADRAKAALATARRDALDLVAEGLSAEGVEVDDDIWCRVSLRALANEAAR